MHHQPGSDENSITSVAASSQFLACQERSLDVPIQSRALVLLLHWHLPVDGSHPGSLLSFQCRCLTARGMVSLPGCTGTCGSTCLQSRLPYLNGNATLLLLSQKPFPCFLSKQTDNEVLGLFYPSLPSLTLSTHRLDRPQFPEWATGESGNPRSRPIPAPDVTPSSIFPESPFPHLFMPQSPSYPPRHYLIIPLVNLSPRVGMTVVTIMPTFLSGHRWNFTPLATQLDFSNLCPDRMIWNRR